TRFSRDWSSDVCSSDLADGEVPPAAVIGHVPVGIARARHLGDQRGGVVEAVEVDREVRELAGQTALEHAPGPLADRPRRAQVLEIGRAPWREGGEATVL